MHISVNENSIVFVDDKNKAQTLELFDQFDDKDAVKAIGRELNAQGSASKAAVSLMANILNHPSMDGYKGQTPWTERISNELKQAMRRAEDEYITPLFMAMHGNPQSHAGVHVNTLTPEQKKEREKFAHVSKMLSAYLTDLRAGGSYAVARGFVLEYFAKAGERPIASNGKMLSVAALKKILDLKRKEHAAPVAHEGIAGKLVSLSAEIQNRTEKTDLGDYATAIAALKAMLNAYEALHSEMLERLTEVKGNIVEQAQAVTEKAKESAKVQETAPF